VLLGLPGAPTPAPALAAKCPVGESKDTATGVCVPLPPTDVVEMTTPEFGGPPEIDGVPCTGRNSDGCIDLAQESAAAGPTPSPTAILTSSP
jgi:hypothetical protein